jgi:hypothetical protein
MENNIDKITEGWLKNLEAEDPSSSFTANVMQSVYALNNSTQKTFNYWWLLTFIPLLAAGGWYLSTLPAFMEKFNAFVTVLKNYYEAGNATFGDIFKSFKSISISPMVILGFLAVLSLLLLDDIFKKSKDSKLKAETKY